MNANYKRGVRNEYRSMRLLEAAGYSTLRSAGSHSPFDLVAYNSSGIVFVQCKTNSWPSPAELETLSSIPVPANCSKVVHRWDTRSHLPQIKEV